MYWINSLGQPRGIQMALIVLGVLAYMVSLGASSRRADAGDDEVLARLVGGKNNYEGKVEIRYKGKWKGVCDHGWGMNEARVACRMIGYPDAERFTTGLYFGYGITGYWMDDVECDDDKYSLLECARKNWGRHNCRSDSPAGAVCKSADEDIKLRPQSSKPSGKVSDLKVRLMGVIQEDYVSEGAVQVKREGRWGYICPTDWGYNEARVVCGQLGFPDAAKSNVYRAAAPAGNVTYWMKNVTCSGTESSLVSCDHKGWGPRECEDNHVVNVSCSRSVAPKRSDVRLRSGVQVWEGRVEIKLNDQWGTVCDDDWDLLDASVVCRSLGYGSAAFAIHRAYFGQGVWDVLKDDVTCTGWENNIEECRSLGKEASDCEDGHYEDAGVECHAPSLYRHKIRLRDGVNAMEGRVEVFRGEEWGTVCADDWDLEEAGVVCRQLKLGYARYASKGNYFSSSRSRPMLMSGVDCRHDERSLYHCLHHDDVKCSSPRKTAGVICAHELSDLVLHTDHMRVSLKTERIRLSYLRCPYEEKCLSDTAERLWRRRAYFSRSLLRFTAYIQNQGLVDFKPIAPRNAWQWHQCHQHYHSMEVFTHYDLLLSRNGHKVAQGHKASFCLEDTNCDRGIEKKFTCKGGAAQGLSPHCQDIYSWKLDCQWIDITDVGAGTFTLRVNVNPGRQVAESDFTNNIVVCTLRNYGSYVIGMRCSYKDCESGVDTHGGNSKGACCHFPFKYKGKMYNSCITGSTKYLWCATTADYGRDRKYGKCFTDD